MIAATAHFRSNNFAWLKLVALALMLFDHAAACYLRALDLPQNSSLLRVPGRFCIPVFAFLVAYGYLNFSRDRARYVLRVALVAVIAEPCYWLCFHEFGNAFIPLAFALVTFEVVDVRGALFKRLLYVCLFGVVVFVAFLTESYQVLFVYLMCICFRLAIEIDNAWFLPAFGLAYFCNWPSLATGVALFVTFALIVVAQQVDVCLPRIRLPKAVAYCFYPGHLLLLSLFFQRG